MSKKSSARTGSEGDAADTAFSDAYNNICSRSSSCKSKRDLDGGPYGDSPAERYQHNFKDCLFLMIHDNEDSTETSDENDSARELYNLKNDYLRKLNILRRNLNLAEISEEKEKSSSQRCTTTEIECQNGNIPNEGKHEDTNLEQEKISSGKFVNENKSESFNLTTIHPFTLNYTADSRSAVNLLDLDYNPPKKKVCCRIKTPKFPTTSSDSSLPYYTKVGLREDLFKEEDLPKEKKSPQKVVSRKSISKFTDTKETQCVEEEFKDLEIAPKSGTIVFTERASCNLFPEIVVKSEKENNYLKTNVTTLYSRNQTPTITSKGDKENEENNFISLNSVISHNDGNTATRPNSIIAVDRKKDRKNKKRISFEKGNKVHSSDISMWDEFTRLPSAENKRIIHEKELKLREAYSPTLNKITNYIEKCRKNLRLQNVVEAEDFKETNRAEEIDSSQYLHQYLNYKRDIKKVKLLPTNNENNKSVPFGTRIVHSFNKFKHTEEDCGGQEPLDIEVEETDKEDLDSSNAKDTDESIKDSSKEGRTFWENLCACFCWRATPEVEEF